MWDSRIGAFFAVMRKSNKIALHKVIDSEVFRYIIILAFWFRDTKL